MATEQASAQGRGLYLYGIVPAEVETDPEIEGIGDPPGRITTVRYGEIAALVSDLTVDRPLGTPEDLAHHAHILDASAGEVPVLPLRFGSVVTDEDAVAEELLGAHHDEFHAALRELEGKAEYIVKGRYDERSILAEILAENEQAAKLAEVVRDRPEESSREERIALGELITNALATKREADTDEALRLLDRLGLVVTVREPTHERDAVYLACLAEVAKQSDLEQTVGELAEQWRGRVEMRLLGPLAPYDFVSTHSGQR